MNLPLKYSGFFDVNAATAKVKSFFNDVKNADFMDAPAKPGEHPSVTVFVEQEKLQIFFEPQLIRIENQLSTDIDSLLNYITFLAGQSDLIGSIFGKLNDLSPDYQYISTVRSSPDLTIVRFDWRENPASFKQVNLGGKIQLLLDTLPGTSITEAESERIKMDILSVEQKINAETGAN